MYLRQRNNGVWYFRRPVPSDLTDVFHSSRFTQSLGTCKKSEALQPYAAALAQSEFVIAQAREKIEAATKRGQDKVYPLWQKRKRILAEKAKRKRARAFCQYNEGDILHLVSCWFEKEKRETETIYRDFHVTIETEEERENLLEDLSQQQAYLVGRPPEMMEIVISEQVLSILDAEDCESPREGLNDPLFRRFYGLVAEGLLYLNRIATSLLKTGAMPERFQGLQAIELTTATPAQFAPFTNTPSGTTAAHSITLDELIERFQNAPRRQRYRPASREEYHFIYRLLREHFGGGRPIASITRDDIIAVTETIRHIPAHATLIDKTTPLQTIAARAKAEGKTSHIKTYNKKVGHLTALFGYAVTEQLLLKSPAPSLKETEPGSDGDAKRFDIEQLKTIFGGYFFTDFIKDGQLLNFVPNHPAQPCRFWAPLIALFHGMRSNEILQIQISNIVQRDNIWTLKVLGELKGIPSYRLSPIHPELIRLGFLDYVNRVKKAGYQSLFPDAKKSSDGKYSTWFQKPWAYYLRKIGVKKGRNECFHSFRHTWNTGMRRGDIPEEIRKILGGWSNSSAESGYGAQDMGRLLKYLEKLSYPGLSLSPLYPQRTE